MILGKHNEQGRLSESLEYLLCKDFSDRHRSIDRHLNKALLELRQKDHERG